MPPRTSTFTRMVRLTERPARALAFKAVEDQALSREDALKRHPELRPAFNELTVGKLRYSQEPERLRAVRDGSQERLDAGQIPTAPRPGEPLKTSDAERQKGR